MHDSAASRRSGRSALHQCPGLPAAGPSLTGGLGELGRVGRLVRDRWDCRATAGGFRIAPAARPLGIWQASAAVAVFDADPPDAGKSPVSAWVLMGCIIISERQNRMCFPACRVLNGMPVCATTFLL